MVGLRGLEPPTLRLSGVRSNHLSYKPMRFGGGRRFRLPTPFGGDEEDRTPDPLLAKQVLSQLSYTPITGTFKIEQCSTLVSDRAMMPLRHCSLERR